MMLNKNRSAHLAFQNFFVRSVLLIVLLNSGFAAATYADALGSFQQVETKTLDGEDFLFPDDIKGESLNIVMLAMSNDQDNGVWQGDVLAEWYSALEEQGVLSDDVLAYHFSVMKVPFFIKGLVRGDMAKSYKDKMPLDQAAAIFVKDLDKFAAAPGIKLDGQPTIVLVAPGGKLLELVKGEPTPENLAVLSSAIATYLEPGA